MIWKPHLAVNKKTLGTLVPRHHGDMSYNIFKAGRSSKDGLDMESRTPPWKALFAWSSARELTRIRPRKFWHFDMFTWGGRGSGRIEEFKKMLTGAPLLPSRRFSLTHVFAALVLLSLLVPFFSLIYADREPGTDYCKPQSKIQNPTLQFDLDWQ